MTFYTEFPKDAKRMTKSELIGIAEKNCAVCESGFYENNAGEKVDITQARDRALQTVITIKSDYTFQKGLEMKPSRAGVIEVTRETTIGASHRLIVEDKLRAVALNFANPFEPGGGLWRASLAQEEAICRSSILYDVIKTQEDMYSAASHDDVLFTDTMILSPDVPCIRDDPCVFLDEPFNASFITCAAPYAYDYHGDPEILRQTLETRIRKIVLCGVEHGYEAIILGAFGCGAFGNSIKDVAQIFRKVLFDEGLRYRFAKVTFAVFGRVEENFTEIQRALAE